MKCPRCGGFLLSGSQVCPSCWTQLTQTPETILPIQQSIVPLRGAQMAMSHQALMGLIATGIIIGIVCSVLVAFVALKDEGGDGYYGSDVERITVTLAVPEVQRQMRDGEMVWDAILNIQKITPVDKKVLWTEARVLIKSESGSILLQATALSADNSSAYDDTAPITVQVWYVETTRGDTKMSAGDAIKLTGMSDWYEGATIEIRKGGDIIGHATMPTNFP